jgi:Holliday junction DNA helicase RuvB
MADTNNKNLVFKDLTQKNPLDQDLRPRLFSEFIGQERATGNLQVFLKAARMREEPLDHVLLLGMPGLGKTTLSHIIANELSVEMKVTSGPVLERAGDLVGLLSNLRKGDIIFIDEIHRLPRTVEEYLYSAMEENAVDLVLDQGPAARSVRFHLERFTLIGATTREGLLTGPFRSRFGVIEKLDLYPVDELSSILRRSADIMDIAATEEALAILAGRSRGVPRIANRLLRRIRDLAQVQGRDAVDEATVEQGLEMMGIDAAGLVATDRRILGAVAVGGGEPVGLKTIAVSVGEDDGTIEEVYEPFLIRKGFLVKTPRGRKITEAGLAHLKINLDADSDIQKGLFS